jgi:hypothetical protein
MMTRKEPDQELFDLTYKTCKELGYDVYDTSPPEGTTYPYVRIGTVQVIPQPTKSYLIGKLFLEFDVFGEMHQRKQVSQMTANILNVLSNYKRTPTGYQLGMVYSNSGWTIMTDQTTEKDLVFAQANAEFKFN